MFLHHLASEIGQEVVFLLSFLLRFRNCYSCRKKSNSGISTFWKTRVPIPNSFTFGALAFSSLTVRTENIENDNVASHIKKLPPILKTQITKRLSGG